LAEFLDDPFGEEFQFLEVSSPGVDRPLTFPWQFSKHVGRRLRCELKDHSYVEGVLQEVTQDSILLAQGQTPRRIPFAELLQAFVLLQW
jgi:ribosome maturation factor RimP